MTAKEIEAFFRSKLQIDDERELENVIAYYIDAHRSCTPEIKKLEIDANRINNGEPIQYVTNTSFFYGERLYVDTAVLIPRPETEELVHWVVSDLGKTSKPKKILDIGTGSGCIILLIAKLTNSKCYGLDASGASIEVAQKNAQKLGVNCDFKVTDILDSSFDLKKGYDIIVSNPPYILTNEKSRMGKSVVLHEPESALFVEGKDPLVFYKRIIEVTLRDTTDKVSLYFEISEFFKEEFEDYLIKMELNFSFQKDLSGKWRMLKIML